MSLLSLSNQDRELHKETVLSARDRAESLLLLRVITAAHSRGDVESKEGIADCKTDRKLTKTMTLTATLGFKNKANTQLFDFVYGTTDPG